MRTHRQRAWQCWVATLVIVAAAGLVSAAYQLELVKPSRSGSSYYSDGRIEIRFALRPSVTGSSYEGLSFYIRNLTSQEIEIDWNRSSIWLPNGEMSRLIHRGVKFVLADTSVPPTVIPPGRAISDYVIPTRAISLSLIGWRVKPIDLKPGAQIGLYLATRGDCLPSGYDFVLQARRSQPRLRTVNVDTRHLVVAALLVIGSGMILL